MTHSPYDILWMQFLTDVNTLGWKKWGFTCYKALFPGKKSHNQRVECAGKMKTTPTYEMNIDTWQVIFQKIHVQSFFFAMFNAYFEAILCNFCTFVKLRTENCMSITGKSAVKRTNSVKNWKKIKWGIQFPFTQFWLSFDSVLTQFWLSFWHCFE